MRRIDKLHLEHPFAGARMLRDMLRREGLDVGRLWRDDLDERGATNRMRMSRRGDDAGVD
jgi:hypothetical protein